MKVWNTLLFLVFAGPCFAQFTDNFSDLNFTSNPAWTGDLGKFMIDTDTLLQSNGSQTNTDTLHLATASASINNTEWNFLLKLDFNPTANTNYVKIYLCSDQSDLEGPLNGYFIRMGETGSSDTLELYRQTGSDDTLLLTGVTAYGSTTFARIKVTRDNAGNWDLFSDPSGGTGFVHEGSVTDNTHTATSFFGVYCRYSTLSRFDQYFFDDFYVGPIQVDTDTPSISSITVLSDTTLDIKFDETMEQTSAETLSNYQVDNGIGNPSIAMKDGSDGSLVHLTFANPFVNGQNYTLTVNNVEDLNNNPIQNETGNFIFFQAQPGDVVINEIYPDTNPSFGLPNAEFVELLNTSGTAIDLANWTLSDPSKTGVIPAYILQPDSFLILTEAKGQTEYSAHGPTVTVDPWPSLNNGGDNLTLADATGQTIFHVPYTDEWYKDTDKDDGGFTLEMIDPASDCQGEHNWRASNNPLGGTPGTANSVFGTFNDTSAPEILTISILSAALIEVQFDELVDSASAAQAANFSIDNQIGTPTSATPVGPDFTNVQLSLGTNIASGIIYSLTVSNIKDCFGNTASETASFAIPGDPDPFDVVIHEIMADDNPVVALPPAEFVELYNNSEKAFDLSGWKFSDQGASPAELGSYLLLPDAYLILCEEDEAPLFEPYGPVLGVSGLPDLTNSGELLSLMDDKGNFIHAVEYADSWYGDLLKKEGGWTLEMIDADNPCTGKDNWTASEDPKGGTPGQPNSVSGSNPDTRAPEIIRASVEDSLTVALYFNEILDSASASTPDNYAIDRGIGQPQQANLSAPGYNKVLLTLPEPLAAQTIYTISFTGLSDCAGNMIDASVKVGIPDPMLALDLVINEILFNPFSFGVDFVEVYNRSDKILSLADMRLGNRDLVADTLNKVELVTTENFLIFPGEYLVITGSPADVLNFYETPNPNGFLEASGIPGYDDDEGVVVLMDKVGQVIDEFQYSDEMHFELINDLNGVSLERIDPERPTQDEHNWHSAASTVGYATPAYENSQFAAAGAAEDPIHVEPEVFSPDGDGVHDFLTIQYQLENSGHVANINCYDANGRLVRNLVQNELLAKSGKFIWDGVTEEGEKARMGIYIVYVELFDLDGNVQKFKKTAVVGGSF